MASNPSNHEIQQNKTATSTGKDVFQPSTVQNNTVNLSVTQVQTAVSSIVAVAGGTYGDTSINQTISGNISLQVGNTGGDQTQKVSDESKGGQGASVGPQSLSGASDAAMTTSHEQNNG